MNQSYKKPIDIIIKSDRAPCFFSNIPLSEKAQLLLEELITIDEIKEECRGNTEVYDSHTAMFYFINKLFTSSCADMLVKEIKHIYSDTLLKAAKQKVKKDMEYRQRELLKNEQSLEVS